MSETPLESYQYTEEEKQAIWKELGVTESSLNQGVNNILEWFEKQPHLAGVVIDKVMVEKLIILSKGSVERAKERVEKLYKYRSLAPELIQNREPVLRNPRTKLFENFTKVSLPKLYEGKRICVLQIPPDVLEIDTEEFYKKGFILYDLRLKFDYWLSDIWVVDGRNLSAGVILSMKLNLVKKASHILLDGLKWRIHSIHCINWPFSPSISQIVLDFFSQFGSSVLMSRIVMHDSLESLHKHIPRDCLPKDYGGSTPSIKEVGDNLEKELQNPKLIDFLLECTKMVSDESKRLNGENVEEMAGSFRKLEVD